MADHTIYLTQLPEETQKHLRQSIKMARHFLLLAESRLRAYEADTAEETTDSVYKTVQNLREASAITEAMLNELVEAHELGEIWKGVPDQYRKDFAEILADRAISSE